MMRKKMRMRRMRRTRRMRRMRKKIRIIFMRMMMVTVRMTIAVT